MFWLEVFSRRRNGDEQLLLEKACKLNYLYFSINPLANRPRLSSLKRPDERFLRASEINVC